jgi:hypothetical protein
MSLSGHLFVLLNNYGVTLCDINLVNFSFESFHVIGQEELNIFMFVINVSLCSLVYKGF